MIDGVRESAQWRELLLDPKRRGLTLGRELAVADGALGFWQVVQEVWPATRGQACWVHNTATSCTRSLNGEARRRGIAGTEARTGEARFKTQRPRLPREQAFAHVRALPSSVPRPAVPA